MAAEAHSIGGRLIVQRQRRGMTQQQLADTSGASVGIIRKLEQGQRQSVRLETLTALAHALDVTAGDLVGKPRGLATGAEDSEMVQLRRAVLGLADLDTAPVAARTLQPGVAQLWQLYWAGSYPVLARALPERISAARVAVSTAAKPDQPIAATVLAETLQITAALLAHLAYEDLAHLALHGAKRAAEHADDELLEAAQQATRSWVLSRQGLWPEAEHLATTTAERIEPKLSTATVDQLAVWGELLRYAAVALSRSGRHSEAAEVIQLMGSAATRLGDDPVSRYVGMPFGPTVVGMRAVDAAISAGQPRQALLRAQLVEHPDRMPPAMHARYLLNVAWAQTIDVRSGEAVGTVLRAEKLAPEALPHQSIARAIVAELLPRRRTQRLPGLRALAQRMGMDT